MRPIALAVAILMTMTAAQTPPNPTTLAQMKDLYRPVLIFGATGDPRLREQRDILQPHRNELIERQIMLVPFFHKYAGGVDTAIITFLGQEEPSLRKRFHVKDDDFTVILLGKDGGEKLRSHQPISFEKLRDTIDAMPMRKHEMQNHPKS